MAQLLLNSKNAFRVLQIYLVAARFVLEYCEGYFSALPWGKGYFFNSFNYASYLQYHAKDTYDMTDIGYLSSNSNLPT